MDFKTPAKIGDRIIMTCSWDVDVAGDKRVTWYRNTVSYEGPIFPSDVRGGDTALEDGPSDRFSALPMISNLTNHSIVLSGIRRDDVGQYYCSLKVTLIEWTSEYKMLTVWGK